MRRVSRPGEMADGGDHVDRAVQQIGGPPRRVVAHRRRPLADGDHDPHRTVGWNRTRLEAGELRHLARDQGGSGFDRGTAVGTEHLPAGGADEPGHVLDGAGTTSVGVISRTGREPIRTGTDHGVEFGGGRADERFVQHRHRDGGRAAEGGDHTERGAAADPDPRRRRPVPAPRRMRIDRVRSCSRAHRGRGRLARRDPRRVRPARTQGERRRAPADRPR